MILVVIAGSQTLNIKLLNRALLWISMLKKIVETKLCNGKPQIGDYFNNQKMTDDSIAEADNLGDDEYDNMSTSVDLYGIIVSIQLVLFAITYLIFVGFVMPAVDFEHSGSLLQGILRWSFFNILVPVVGLMTLAFGRTKLPMTIIFIFTLISTLFNSIAFLVFFTNFALTCNDPNQAGNICNDPLYDCVYVAPCTTGYPQSKADLKAYDSFVFGFVLEGILALITASLIILVSLFKLQRIGHEKDFVMSTLVDDDSPREKDVSRKGSSKNLGNMFTKISHPIANLIDKTVAELGSVTSASGFSAQSITSRNGKLKIT